MADKIKSEDFIKAFGENGVKETEHHFVEERPQVAYLCKYHKEPHYCKHTTRIEDALNFVKLEDGKYMEVDHTTESAE